MRAQRDLIAAIAAAALCALVALAVPLEAVSVLAALPLCFLLPGYAVTTAVFGPDPLPRQQTFLLTLGLSLTTLATGALLLNYLPGGIRGGSWAGLLFLVVLACSLVAARRRTTELRHSSAGPAPAWPGPHWPRLRLRARDGAMLGGAAICVVAALVLSWTPLPAKNVVGYTQLWMLSGTDSAGAKVRVGVGSDEVERRAYRLEVRERGGGPLFSEHLVLKPGQQFVKTVRLGEPPSNGRARVVALLYREKRPNKIYRRTTGWVLSG